MSFSEKIKKSFDNFKNQKQEPKAVFTVNTGQDSKYFDPIPQGTTLEPTLKFNQVSMDNHTMEHDSSNSNDDYIRLVVADSVNQSMKSVRSSDTAHHKQMVADISAMGFDKSAHGGQLTQVNKLSSFYQGVSAQANNRLESAYAARDSHSQWHSIISGNLNAKSLITIIVGVVSVLAVTMGCYELFKSEIKNGSFIFEGSGYFDSYDEKDRALMIFSFTFVLIGALFIGLKAMPTVLTLKARSQFNFGKVLLLLVSVASAIILFALKTGGKFEANQSGFGDPNQTWQDQIPFSLFAVNILLCAALSISIATDYLCTICLRYLPIELEPNPGYHHDKDRTLLLESAAGETVGDYAQLIAKRDQLLSIKAHQLILDSCKFEAFRIILLNEIDKTIAKFVSKGLVILVGMLAVGSSGCLSTGIHKENSTVTTHKVSHDETTSTVNHEWFIISSEMSPESMKLQWDALTKLVLDQASAGDRIVVLSGAGHSVIETIVIPEGNRGRRQRDPDLKSAMFGLKSHFVRDGSNSTGNTQVNLPGIPAAVAAVRQTDFPCKVIIAGDPIYDDPTQRAWSGVDGHTPYDESLDDPKSPYGRLTRFPEGTKVSWLLPNMGYGRGTQHADATLRFNRLFIQEHGGELIQITPDPDTAFKFCNSRFADQVTKRINSGSGMEISHVEGERSSDAATEHKVIVPVNQQKFDLSIPRPTTQFEGLKREELEAVLSLGRMTHNVDLIILRDDSGSMDHAKELNSKVLMILGQTLPVIAPDFNMAVLKYAGAKNAIMPLTPLFPIERDKGASLDILGKFLSQEKAEGGYADMQVALESATKQFTRSNRRQILMVIGDTAEETASGKSEFFDVRQVAIKQTLSDWINEQRALRSCILVYVPGMNTTDTPTERLMKELAISLPNCNFSRDPGQMLTLILDQLKSNR